MLPSDETRLVVVIKPDLEEVEMIGIFNDTVQANFYCLENMGHLRSKNDYWAILRTAAAIDSNGNYVWEAN